MSEFRNREKRQALLFITLGLVVTFFSYQNFQYPQTIRKSNIDLSSGVYASDAEIARTRQRLNPQASASAQGVTRTQVVEAEAPMQLKLKRAPATKKKSSQKKSVKKKSKKPNNKKSKKKSSN